MSGNHTYLKHSSVDLSNLVINDKIYVNKSGGKRLYGNYKNGGKSGPLDVLTPRMGLPFGFSVTDPAKFGNGKPGGDIRYSFDGTFTNIDVDEEMQQFHKLIEGVDDICWKAIVKNQSQLLGIDMENEKEALKIDDYRMRGMILMPSIHINKSKDNKTRYEDSMRFKVYPSKKDAPPGQPFDCGIFDQDKKPIEDPTTIPNKSAGRFVVRFSGMVIIGKLVYTMWTAMQAVIYQPNVPTYNATVCVIEDDEVATQQEVSEENMEDDDSVDGGEEGGEEGGEDEGEEEGEYTYDESDAESD